MSCESNNYWTNFDLFYAVKRICEEKNVSMYKRHKLVAEDILYELGELSINSTQSDEEKKLIQSFTMKYFRVISKFEPYRMNFERPAIQNYGREIFWTIKDKNPIDDSDVIMLSQESSSSQECIPQESDTNSRNYKSLGDLKLGSNQMRKRLRPIVDEIKNHAMINKIDVTRLLGLLIHNINYSATGEGSKSKAAIGISLFTENVPDSEMSNDQALSVLTKYKLGKRQYTDLRLDLKSYTLLPTYNNVKVHKDMLLPKTDILPETLVGIKFLYKDALISHFTRFFEMHPELKSLSYKSLIKDGCDGSGKHSIYNQIDNVNVNNMMSYMFVVLEIYENNGNVDQQDEMAPIFTDPLPNSADASRPIALIMGKESSESLGEFIPIIQNEIAEIQEDGLCIFNNDRAINVTIEIKSTMTDGKIKKLLTGRGGAYCIVSNCTRENGNIAQKYLDGFPLEGVSLKELWDMFFSIEKDGKISEKIPTNGIGLTQKPLLSSTNVDYLANLHALMRIFEWALKTVYHRRGGIHTWEEHDEDRKILKIMKKEVTQILEEKTGIKVDQPDSTGAGGNSNTGNTVRRIFWNQDYRNLLVECAPEEDQKSLKVIFRNLAIITRLISSDFKINVEKLDIICKETAVLILNHFNGQIRIPDTLHVLLGHVCSLVEANGGHGFKKLSEEPLESNNKLIRKFRESLARKTNQLENLTDVATRLWVKSDPIIRSLKRALYCKVCDKFSDHTMRSSQCPQKIIYSPRQSDDAFLLQFIVNQDGNI